jgi:hypothetical protein
MPTSPPSDLAMRQYLLGQSSEAERQTIDELYFDDSELFERLTAIDDDLIEAYADGTLPPDDRDAFESTLAVMPRRQARLFIVRELAARASSRPRRAPVRTVASATSPALHRGWFDFGVLQWSLAAATVVLAVTAAYLGWQTSLLRSELEVARGASRTGQGTPVGASQTPSNDATLPASPAPVPVLAVSLTPVLVRDVGIPVVTIAPETLLVRFTLVLASPGSRHSVRLLSTSRDERWRESGVAPGRAGMRSAVVVDLPARLLTAGEYVLEVSSDSAGIEDYHFRASPR